MTKRVGRLNQSRKRHGRRNKTTDDTFCLRRNGPYFIYVAKVSTDKITTGLDNINTVSRAKLAGSYGSYDRSWSLQSWAEFV